ncbi:hypothetical protein CUMW_189990, partial [Citrus unshiu]
HSTLFCCSKQKSRRYIDLVLLTTLHRNSIQYSLNTCEKCRKVLIGCPIRRHVILPTTKPRN